MTVYNNYYRAEDGDEAFVLLIIAISQGRTLNSLTQSHLIDLDNIKCVSFSNQLPKLDEYNVMNNYAGNTIKLYTEDIGTINPTRFIKRYYHNLLVKGNIPTLPKHMPIKKYKFDIESVPLYDKRMYLSDINKAYHIVTSKYLDT